MKYTKDFARYYIKYQDNLSESDKVALLNFVKESSDLQVSGLLYFGKMYEQHEIVDIITESPLYDLGEKFKADRGQLQMKFQKAKTALKKSMRSPEYYGKTPIQKHRIWQAKFKTIETKFEKDYENLAASFKAAKNKLMGIKDPTTKAIIKKKGLTLGKVAPTLLIAAGIATASYVIYKRFLSKAAKACNSKKSSEKTLCMQQYKKKATQARIRNMQSQMKQCDKTKDPAKCKAKTMSTIRHLQSKI